MSLDPFASPTGYLAGPSLGSDLVGGLREMVGRLAIADSQPFFASNVHLAPSEAQAVNDAIESILGPWLQQHFPGRSSFLGAVISKGQSEHSGVEFHQDWTYTNERRHRAVLVWIPLVEAASDNGGLRFVPGSHRWTTGIRPFTTAQPTSGFQSELRQLSVAVDLPPGSSVCYDPAAIHGSSARRERGVRPAVAVALRPAGADLLHFHRRSGRSLVGWKVDAQFFQAHRFGDPPSCSTEVHAWTGAVEPGDFARRVTGDLAGGS